MLDESGGHAGTPGPWLELAPGSVVAGFTLEGPLASGSFGCVYRASRGGRPFALKLVLIEPRSDREVDALRLMRHPNVVCFHGLGFWPEENPRFLVLALELVEGRTLEVWAPEENLSALELVMQVLLPFALTLAEVHAAGVVHRDIKEANIVMREEDGQPVLVDFGAAGLEGARRLTMRLPPGTPEYRSPEALRFANEWEGEPYPFQPGDDLWALGVVTYWLLTRTLPFGDRNNPGLMRAILHETPLAPQERNPRVPPALGELCMRMLEKEPEARYANARVLAEALCAAWAGADRSWREPLFPGGRREKRPAPAPPPPLAAPRSQAPRRRWLAGLAVAAVLGALSLMTPLTQRTELPPPPPSQQASPRQEMAPVQLTGDVGGGAAPEKSSTPAPVIPVTNNSEAPPQLRVRLKQVQVQLAQSGGLRDLIASDTLSDSGVQALNFSKVFGHTEGVLSFREGVSYRANRSVATEVSLANLSSEPWTATEASLVDAQGKELVGLKLRQEKPIQPLEEGSVIVELKAKREEAHGELKLTLRDEGSRAITLVGVTFP